MKPDRKTRTVLKGVVERHEQNGLPTYITDEDRDHVRALVRLGLAQYHPTEKPVAHVVMLRRARGEEEPPARTHVVPTARGRILANPTHPKRKRRK